MRQFPFIMARGTPRELGRQHGEQCRACLLGFLDYLGAVLKLSRAEIRSRALCFLPLFERHCPHLVDEVRGLAEGAGVEFAEALAVQIRGELGLAGDGGCTTFVVAACGTSTGSVLIGQNSDVEPEYDAFAYMLRLEPLDGPALLMWTFGGQLGYHGISATGVAHFANSLGGGPAWKFGLPHYPIKRMMLEQRTLADILELWRRVPVCSSGNYVVCDGAGRIADIEATPEGIVMQQDARFLVHANHFLCAPFACAANDQAALPDSLLRQKRIHDLIAEQFGRLGVEDLKRILADHEGQPTSICRHPHDGADHPSVSARGRTTASLIAEPAAGKLHVSRGNPCTTPYQTYGL